MGYCFEPYAIDLAHIRSLLGGGDASLVSTLKSRYAYDFEATVGVDDVEVTLEEAMRELLLGNELHRSQAVLYEHSFHLFCVEFGRFLFTDGWDQYFGAWLEVFNWIETVDHALRDIGVDDDVLGIGTHLAFRHTPVPVPRSDQYMGIGYLLKSEIPDALSALVGASTESLEGEVRQAIEQLREWLEICQRESRDLVCFIN